MRKYSAWIPTSPIHVYVSLLSPGNHTGAVIQVTFMVIIVCVITWYVPPAGVVELAAEVLAKSRQVWLPVWHLIHVQGVEQHLGIGGAASTLDLLQETSTFSVVGGENLETTHNKDRCLIKWWVVNFYLSLHTAQTSQHAVWD